MGHLINPIGFRLSFFKSWEDSWFVKNVYYPEFLNGMLKLRNYLYFFLSSKKMLKSGIFLSNFFIIKYNKIYIINIYIYHIDFEKLSFECINRLYSSFFSYNRNNKIRKIPDYFKLFSNNVDIYFFFIFFYKIFYKKKIKKKYIFIKKNIFFQSELFVNYYNSLLEIYNELSFNKLFKNKSVEAFFNKRIKNKNNKKNIYFFYYNFLLKKNINNFNNFNYKSFNLNLKLNSDEKEKNDLNINLTIFEFIIYLLQKMNLNFKSSVYNKIYKLKNSLLFLEIFKYLKYKLLKFKFNFNFLIYFFNIILKNILLGILNKYNIHIFRDKVYFLIYYFLGYKFFFKHFKIIIPFLNNIFIILNNIKNISYKIFFLSNKNITARWLCRYIGIKLKNNYSFYHVINPIKKELYKLCRLNTRKNYSKLLSFNKFLKKNNYKYKLNFKNNICKFFLLYIKENFFYYVYNNNYMYDLYIYFNNKDNKILSFFKFLKVYKYIYINIFINFYWEFNLLKIKKIFKNFLYKIYNFTLSNFDNKLNVELKKFSFSTFFFKNLIKYNYYKHLWSKLKNINKRNMRFNSNSNTVLKYCNLLVGYKLSFKGRFSRKQRASNIWYLHGKMPLNTLSVKLDYYFFTIPLKNSAISIKIILYKKLFNEKYKYLLIY